MEMPYWHQNAAVEGRFWHTFGALLVGGLKRLTGLKSEARNPSAEGSPESDIRTK
jgi:hypothetical protein